MADRLAAPPPEEAADIDVGFLAQGALRLTITDKKFLANCKETLDLPSPSTGPR